MINKVVVGKVVIEDWFLPLYRLQNEKENMDYDDDYEIIGHELVYHDSSKDVLLNNLGEFNIILENMDMDFTCFSEPNIFELAKILAEIHNLGKVVDINSKLYQGVAESKGVFLTEYPLKIGNSNVEFVVHRSHLLYDNHGFFKVTAKLDNLNKFRLELLCE